MNEIDDWSWSKISKNFDEHVIEQLPWYNIVSESIAFLARCYTPHGGTIIDVGASTGNMARLLEPLIVERNINLIEIDSEVDMQNKNLVHIKAEDYSPVPHDVSIWNLTLMFVPPAVRQQTIKKYFDALNPGGVMVGVDRINIQSKHYLTMSRLVLSQKKCDPKQIYEKELKLCGVQRPLETTPGDTWFQYADFIGWIKTKPEQT